MDSLDSRFHLHISPQRFFTRSEFHAVPRPRVAIEAAEVDPGWQPNQLVIDHHRGVLRPFSDSACKQMFVARRDAWRHLCRNMPAGTPVHVLLCRVDEDTCLAYALLLRPELGDDPRIARLVAVEDVLDRSGGTDRGDATDEELAVIAWINEPYHRRRHLLARGHLAESFEVLRRVVDRILAYADGRFGSLPVTGSFTERLRDRNVAVIVEDGPYPRLGLRDAGIDVFIAVREEDGRTVSIGLTGLFVPVDLPAVYDELNTLDTAAGTWGGSTHIGGSPLTGTALSADEIMAVVVRHRWGRPPVK